MELVLGKGHRNRDLFFGVEAEETNHERIFLNILFKTCSVSQKFFLASFSICFLKSENGR